MSEAELKKNILILKGSRNAISGVETFLKNRDWSIFSTTDIKEAITYAMEKNPTYILISVDHPNTKVSMLPKVLKQSAPFVIIAFAEGNNSKSVGLLNAYEADYRVYPPTTGPAVERCVNKHLRDKNKKIATKEESTYSNSSDHQKDSLIAIKDKNFNHLSDSSSALKKQNTSINITSSSSQQNGSNSINFQSENSENQQPGSSFMYGLTEASQKSLHALSEFDQLSNNHFNSDSSTNPNQIQSHGQSEWGPASNNVLPSENSQTNFNQNTTKNDSFTGSENNSFNSNLNSEYSKNNLNALANFDPNSNSHFDANATFAKSVNKNNTKESLIAECAEQSLTEVCTNETTSMPLDIDKYIANANSVCVLIETPRYSGYLVVVDNKKQIPNLEFAAQFQKKLIGFMSDKGEHSTENKNIPIMLNKKDIQPLANTHADFYKNTKQANTDISIAFFPRKELKAELESSELPGMSLMKISDLVGNRVVDFDLFIFLKQNNKVIMCTAKGNIFEENQKNRFEKMGLTHIHFKKEDEHAVSKYYTENYLNDLAESLKQKQLVHSA